jgi:nicotinate-nucleotide pyrophosphorylase (carboxylating)
MSNKTFYRNFDFKAAEKIIRQALKEDVGKGDVTTDLLIPKNNKSVADLMMKEPGIVAGIEIFKLVHKIVDPKTVVHTVCPEGQKINKCARIAQIEGTSRSLLKAERLSLNIIQRMSGIATATYSMTKKLNNASIKIVDTRKTTPNFRMFEKLAVKIGGGDNHRFGLYDMMLIKDNHIEANGGIENTLLKLKKSKIARELKVEIEVQDLNELQTVLKLGRGVVDIVMLDNFSIENIKKAVKLNNKKFKVEVSGGVNYGTIGNFSSIKGINIISVGALTHSVRSLDLSLDFIS